MRALYLTAKAKAGKRLKPPHIPPTATETYGNSKTYYPMPGLSPQTWFLYKEAYDMDMFKVVDLIATIQKHVDQGISFTLFLRDIQHRPDCRRSYHDGHTIRRNLRATHRPPMIVAYYSLTGNTRRLVARLAPPGERVELTRDTTLTEPFVLVTPTYNFGEIRRELSN